MFVLNGQSEEEDTVYKPIGTQAMFMKVYEKVHAISGEITSAFKLRDHRLYEVKGLDKQRVKPAVQLLSNTMAQTIRLIFPNDEPMLNLANWIEETDSWFDVMNSLHDDHINPLKCPYDAHYEKQMAVLKKYKETTRNLKVLWGKDCHMKWQQGVIINCSAVLEMKHYVLIEYKKLEIKTNRLQSDPLERCYGRLRAMAGSYLRFDAVQFTYRLTIYCLGIGCNIAVEKANVECEVDDTKVLTTLLPNHNVMIEKPAEEEKFEDNVNDATIEVSENQPLNVVLALPDDVEEIQDISESTDDVVITPLENFGFHYIAGWLGSKDAKDLVKKVKECYEDENFVQSEWIKMRDFGQLNLPSGQLVSDLKQMDEEFRKFHSEAPGLFAPNDLRRTENVIKDFTEILLEKFPAYPQKLVKRFARARTFFRQRHMQKHILKVESERSKINKIRFSY